MGGLNLFGLTQQMLSASVGLRGIRHELLTSNVTNVDTPGYRSRDFDFAKVMKRLMLEQSTGSRGMGTVSGRIIIASDRLRTLAAAEVEIDKNSADMDREIARLLENSLLYEASINLFSRKLAGLRYAISEGGG